MRIFAYALLTAMAGANGFAEETCDRPCLTGVLNQYLNALIKHDTSAAPLFVGFRQTENAAVVKPGKGLWKTMTGLGNIQRRYLDAVSGQAGFFGTILEGPDAAIVTLRLRVENRKVTEAEWVVARTVGPQANVPPPPGGGLVGPEGLAASPPPSKMLPKEAQTSREAMIAIANSYFDGLQAHDGSVVMEHSGCARIENGGTVTGMGRGRGGDTVDRGDCAAGLQNFTMRVAARRFPIVDEEAGVVLGMVVFIRPPGSTQKRNLLTEWFHIDHNKIRAIYAAMYYPEQDAPAPNWPPYDGNYPLPSLPGMNPDRR